MIQIANVFAVARREFRTRAMTRTFVIATAILVIAVVMVAFLPVIVRYIDRNESQRVAVWTGVTDIGVDPVATIDRLFDGPSGNGTSATGGANVDVSSVSDLASARAAVTAGDYEAVLAIERGSAGDLEFTLYTNGSSTGRTAQLLQQASTTVAIGDRLVRLGVAPSEQAGLLTPAPYKVMWPDTTRPDLARGSVEESANLLLGTGLSMLIFMMIVMYGTWVATSVVEEKSSRVMEVILNAATPFQLLTGKVLGVGAAALTQYAAVLLAGCAALFTQGWVASLVLGADSSEASLPAGLTFGMLGLLVLYGVLGFLLFAVLYAGVGSLVSRQEDVNTVVMPLTLVCSAGYIVAVYTGLGLLDIRPDVMAALSQVPFLSPFMMLGRVTAGGVDAWEIVLSMVTLVAAIVIALWIAARLYAVGVLLYGQRPNPRVVWHLMRTGM
jgi:ABC-2 type transport system permease protein